MENMKGKSDITASLDIGEWTGHGTMEQYEKAGCDNLQFYAKFSGQHLNISPSPIDRCRFFIDTRHYFECRIGNNLRITDDEITFNISGELEYKKLHLSHVIFERIANFFKIIWKKLMRRR